MMSGEVVVDAQVLSWLMAAILLAATVMLVRLAQRTLRQARRLRGTGFGGEDALGNVAGSLAALGPNTPARPAPQRIRTARRG